MTQARLPVFYETYEIPDTLDGRFDVLALHVFLVIHRLRDDPDKEEIVRQLPEKMLSEIDRALRESGISDMGVPRRVKTMAKAFLGRATAYENALRNNVRHDLVDALARNVFPGQDPDKAEIRYLAKYMRACENHLEALNTDTICAGSVSFPNPGAVGHAD
jgi:cytochrome b pre-mRNA-processing protein 3